MAGIRNGIGCGFGIDDGQLQIDGQTQVQVMQGGAASAWARGQHGVVHFDIGDMGVKIPQAVIACVRLDGNCARVPERTSGNWG
ncbi:hypothetical protein RugamoR1_19870 [Rugamonas sp. R1(2021)]